jgi:hypothetical protein
VIAAASGILIRTHREREDKRTREGFNLNYADTDLG